MLCKTNLDVTRIKRFATIWPRLSRLSQHRAQTNHKSAKVIGME